MSVNKKAGAGWKETRHDKWYILAKEQGYRSRAAFKLIQLNKKYQFLDTCKSCLDLGAAPGGWLQVAQKFMPVSSMLIGVDLVPIARMRGVTTIQADITTPECRTLIKKELQGWDVDLVLCDGAPNVAGGQVWSRDAYQQNELVIHALKLATHFLRPKGTFVTKVFRSQDYNALLWALKQLFEIVDVTKPMASRNASAEIFVVCRFYKAPKKIDPFLLDPAHIFQQFESEHAKVKDVFKDKGKTTRSRQGYEDSEMNGLIGTTIDVMEFVRAEEPINLLGAYKSFAFDSEDAKMLLSHSSTNEEVRTLCRDLKVLGKGDFKALLKWRKKVSTFLKELEKEAAGPQEVVDEKPVILTEEEQAELEENNMTAAIAAYHERRTKLAKSQKRKRHEVKQKQAQRLAINVNNLSGSSEMVAGNEGTGQGGLFQLGAINSADTLALLDRAGNEVDEEFVSDSEEEAEMSSESEDEESYYANLERSLDSMYDAYKQKRNILDKKDLEEKAAAEEDKLNNDLEEEIENQRVGGKRKRVEFEDEESEEESEDDEYSNPLLVDLGPKTKESSLIKAQRWFDRDLFEGIDDSNDKQDEEQSSKSKKPPQKRLTLTDMMNMEVVSTDSDDSEAVDSDEDLPNRWLGADDETIEHAQPLSKKAKLAAAAAAPKPVRGPLVGLASMGKTRAAIEQEKVVEAKKVKKAAKDARRNARKAQEALGLLKAEDDDEVMVEESLTTDKDVSDLLMAGRNFRNVEADLNAADSSDEDFEDVVDLDSKKKQKKLARRVRREAGEDNDPTEKDEREAAGFEEVAALSDYSGDDHAVSTTLALGTRAIMKKQREELLDSSYNRFAVDLREQRGLPQWFVHEERLHNTANLPVTKEEVSALKTRLRTINAKPIKKIAEAAARNKQRTERRWLKIKQQMDEVADSITTAGGEGSMVSKIRQMEKLAKKKDKRQEKGDKKYIIARKSGGILSAKQKGEKGGKGGATVKVDARLKKDKRGMKKARANAKTQKTTSNKRKRNQ